MFCLDPLFEEFVRQELQHPYSNGYVHLQEYLPKNEVLLQFHLLEEPCPLLTSFGIQNGTFVRWFVGHFQEKYLKRVDGKNGQSWIEKSPSCGA